MLFGSQMIKLTLLHLDDGLLRTLLPEVDIAEMEDPGDELEDLALVVAREVHRRHRGHHLRVVRRVIRPLDLRRLGHTFVR